MALTRQHGHDLHAAANDLVPGLLRHLSEVDGRLLARQLVDTETRLVGKGRHFLLVLGGE